MLGPHRSFFMCGNGAGTTTVIVFGSHDEEKNMLRSTIAYDVSTEAWVVLPDMSREGDKCCRVWPTREWRHSWSLGMVG
ncbi:hypothetical protein ZIOFF_028738 [Zingiber officinale]|uniref:F-box/kelch-repeat protein n=1 Tax=Zingiber officinale TaxID=94328 RepID=A0A8J5GLQ5_ZINOF|nr:hypothetical protein ZIOFF_028738 [Zingiber officinale]